MNDYLASAVSGIKCFAQSAFQRHDSDGGAKLRPIILRQSGKAVVTSRKRNRVVGPPEFSHSRTELTGFSHSCAFL